MAILFTILMLVLFFKVTGFILGICGKILGAALSLIGYLILGIIVVTGFGFAIIALPIILIIGVISILGAIAHL